MKRIILFGSLLLAGFFLISCSDEQPVTPPPPDDSLNTTQAFVDPEAVAQLLVAQAGWPVDKRVNKQPMAGDGRPWQWITDFEREIVFGDIAHYSFKLRIGPGAHDFIGIHRVVKEKNPNRPICTDKSLFALHGTPGHFEVMFLAGSVMSSAPDDQSMAVYLAQNDVDVWGIDQAYTLVPFEVSDFSFMEGWGMQFDVDNLRTGMAVARMARLFTGSGFGPMNLMGYSTGSNVGMAALDFETQLPPVCRHISGMVFVDYFFKTADPDWNAFECGTFPVIADMLAEGTYQHDYGLLFQTIGFLAQSDPGGESPIIQDFNNMQTALFAGAVTAALFGMPGEMHFFSGIFDESGMPVDLRYTDLTQYLEWLQAFNNYGSNFLEYDLALLHCLAADSPFDDHMAEITVPMFFLGANGAWGDMMDYTASLIGSSDITMLNVQLQDEKYVDIGHVDIATAQNAEVEFWQPVLAWLENH